MSRRFVAVVLSAAGWLAIASGALPGCRQDQPANDPRPEPNSPIPRIQRPDESGRTSSPNGSSADEESKTKTTASDAGK